MMVWIALPIVILMGMLVWADRRECAERRARDTLLEP
jgi:hypothetical protein